MAEEEFFDSQCKLVFHTQKNKRRGRDSVVYEANWVPLTVRAMDARLDKTLRINHNYAFLTSLPRWREIMATEFEGRKIDHEICDFVIPLADAVLSPYTYNNRVGKGSQAAINQLIEHIATVTEGYTKPTRIIKIDFSGYFPNAMWDFAEKCLDEVIDNSHETKERKAYLKWLTMISVHCNPAAHCELRTPKFMWNEHIPESKSILSKDIGIGAAIGRLVWQTAMGLYINDIIKWLTEICGIHLVCFVDDIVMVVPEHQHQYVLSIIPQLREKLKDRNVILNEKKFYDQPYQHGVEFLGSHIKTCRIHLNNKTYGRAVERIKEFNRCTYKNVDNFVQSMNSYTGLLKNRTDYKRLINLVSLTNSSWRKYVGWDKERLCIICNRGYTEKERLNYKYNLNLKHYDKQRKKKCA